MRVGPRALVAAGAMTLALGNLGRIPGGIVGGRSAPVVLIDLLLLPLWITLLVVVGRRLRAWPLDGITRWILAFICVAALSLAQATSLWNLGVGDVLGSAAFLVRWVLYAGWFWLVTVCLTPDEARVGVRQFEWAIYGIAAFGIVQSVALPGFAQLVGSGGADKMWDEQGRRLVSTLLDPNFAGILIVMALLLRLAREREGRGGHRAVLPLLAVALLLTLSRSSLLALAAGVVVLLWTRGIDRRLAGLFLAGSVLLLPFITLLLRFAEGFNKLGLDASAAQRIVPWSRALIMLRDHPWLGVGFNAVQQAQRAYGWQPIGGADVSLDGGLLFVAAMTGGVGLLLYVGLLASAMGACRTVQKESTDGGARALASGTAAATVAVVVHSLFTNSLLLPFVMQVLWLLWGCVVVVGRPIRLPALAVVAPVALLLLTACEPCSGVAACRTAPTMALSGQIVDGTTGKPVRGVVIAALSARAESDGEGLWELSGPLDSKVTTADVTVQAPGKGAYTIRALPVRALTVRGDVQTMGRWTSVPYARFMATLIRHGELLVGASVSFSPTGGVPVLDVAGSGVTNDAGIFGLELAGTGALGAVTGTLTVTPPGVGRVSRLTGFPVQLDYHYDIPRSVATVEVGPLRTYGGEVIFRGTGEKVPGARIEFTRTGGVAITPAIVQSQADGRGFFTLPLDASVDGTVIGDVRVSSADGTKASTYRAVRFATYDSLYLRSSGLWAFGERWAWAVELWRNGILMPAPDVSVEFRRTGGIAITPALIGGRTGSDGRFELKAQVTDTGMVIGDLTVFPATGPPQVIPNLSFRTFEGDELRFGGVYGFGSKLRWAWAVELWTHDRLVPAPDVGVEFRRTGGVAITPDRIGGRTDRDGRFELKAMVTDTGDVIGELAVFPAVGPTRIIPNLRLHTFEGDDLRFGGVYGFGPALRYVGEVLREDGTPVQGAQVTWTQVSGIPASPSTLTTPTDVSGQFPLTLIPSMDGEVVGTVRVVPPAPWAAGTAFIFTLRLNSFETGDLRLAVTYRIPPP